MTQHLAQNCYVTEPENFEATLEYWMSIMQAGPFYVFTVDLDGATYHGRPTKWAGRVAVTMLGETQLEIIAPAPGAEVFTEWIASRGPIPRGGLYHHFRIDTEDFEGTCQRLIDNGATAGASAKAPGGRDVAYIDARDTLGSYVEVLTQNADSLAMMIKMREACEMWDGTEPVRDYVAFMAEALDRPIPGYARG